MHEAKREEERQRLLQRIEEAEKRQQQQRLQEQQHLQEQRVSKQVEDEQDDVLQIEADPIDFD